jgi:hypothetical protein
MDLVAFVDLPSEAMLIERVRFNFHSEVRVFSRSKVGVFRHVRVMPRWGLQRHGKKFRHTQSGPTPIFIEIKETRDTLAADTETA